jgi:hypothetical protein
MSLSPLTPAPATLDVFPFFRWMGEFGAPLLDGGGSAVAGEERNLLDLAQSFTQPWTLIGAQLAMANLALTHAGTAQVEWAQAWWKACSALAGPQAAEGGGRAVLPFDPFALVAQAQAFMGRALDGWAALARTGPVPVA